jgi:glycerate kinase
MIPRTLLVAACAFDAHLSAQRVTSAIGRGLGAGGWETDLCPLAPESVHSERIRSERIRPGSRPDEGRPDEGRRSEDARELLDGLDFDARMRSARAVIVGEPRLQESTLAGSVAFEIATRARQAGVPAYAVTGEDCLDSFDTRILDLQTILEAKKTVKALEAAGRRLAGLV